MAFGISAGAAALVGSVAAPVIGGLLGGGSSGGGGGTATQSMTPWEPAQPFLLKDLQTNQDLQNWYTQNPFNAQQQTGLQNTLSDANHFRANMMPGLMDFANRGMTSSYQRQTGGAPGSGGGYGGVVRPGGLLQGGKGSFSAPQGGLLAPMDWEASNPFKNGHIEALLAQRKAESDIEDKRLKAEKELEALQRNPFNSDYGS